MGAALDDIDGAPIVPYAHFMGWLFAMSAAVVSTLVLGTVSEPEKALAEAHRV
jgi:hypothetical protein